MYRAGRIQIKVPTTQGAQPREIQKRNAQTKGWKIRNATVKQHNLNNEHSQRFLTTRTRHKNAHTQESNERFIAQLKILTINELNSSLEKEKH